MYQIHREYKHLQLWLHNYFVLRLRGPYQILFSFCIQKVLCYARKQ